MVIISYGTIRDFFETHTDAKDALNNWYRLASNADWANYHEISKCLTQLMPLVTIGLFLISGEILIVWW